MVNKVTKQNTIRVSINGTAPDGAKIKVKLFTNMATVAQMIIYLDQAAATPQKTKLIVKP